MRRAKQAGKPAVQKAVGAKARTRKPTRQASELERLKQALEAETAQRRLAEEALQDSEARYHSLVETLPLYVLRKDLEGRFVFANKLFCDTLNKPLEEILGKSDFDYYPRRLAEKYRRNDHEVIESGEVFEDIEEHEKPDGERLYVQVLKSPVYDSRGEPVGIQGVFIDVTARVRAEQALHVSEERYALAQRAANVGTWDWDMRTDTLHWSEQIEPMFGFERGEFGATYEAFLACVHPQDRRKLDDAVDACIKGGADYAIEHRIVWPDGTIRWLSETGDVFRDENGQAVRMLGVVQDITQRKEAEEQLKSTMEELERSNRELEQFAYIASHDLQEPLRMISSFTQLLSKRYQGRLDKDADEFIGFAVEGAKRMQRLLNGLLAYSRVTTRAKPFEPTECESILSQAIDNLRLAIEDAGAVITHDPLPTVPADETQLLQLFQNLIGNAVKFHGDEPPRIHVGAENREGDWLFSVRDNGIGIEPKHFDRVFQIFQRLHGRSEYRGTGIGLAICQKIVHRHNGKIWVESEPGKGSTFYFMLSAQGEPSS